MKDIGVIFSGSNDNFKVNLTIDGDFLSKDFGDDEAGADELMQKCISLQKEWDDILYQDVMKELLGIELSTKFVDLVYVNLESGEVFLKGTKIPMPSLLAETFLKYLDKGYPVEPLVNFWILLMGNPDIDVRESLFKFLSTYEFSITENGNFAAYKYVDTYNTLQGNPHYNSLVALAKIVKGWKKSLNSMMAYILIPSEDEEDTSDLIKMTKVATFKGWEGDKNKSVQKIGLLGDVIEEMESNGETKYVASYNYNEDVKNGVFIDLGVPHNMDRHDCDNNPKRECSKGLHVGSSKYVESFVCSSRPILLCYVNPMNVVAVPQYDTSKMRVSEYYPVCELERITDDNGNRTFKKITNEFLEDSYLPYTEKQVQDIIDNFEAKSKTLKTSTNDEITKEYIDVLKERVKSIKVNS